MSKNQPFCDNYSHRGTFFRPLKFTLEEKVNSMALCGCKLSKQAPFCDGVTCVKLMHGQELDSSIPWGDQDESDGATVDFNSASGEATSAKQP